MHGHPGDSYGGVTLVSPVAFKGTVSSEGYNKAMCAGMHMVTLRSSNTRPLAVSRRGHV